MGRRSKNMTRFYLKDDEYYIICRVCEEHKHCDEYHANKLSPIGKIYVCKECSKDYNKSPSLNKANEYDQEFTKQILTRLGYNIDEDIHQQFLSRLETKYGVILK